MLEEGWYIPAPDPKERTRHPRWLLGVRNGECVYSKGGTQHYNCKSTTFAKWIKRYHAKRNTRADS